MKRTLRSISVAFPLALAVATAIVLPGWVPLFPRAVRRGMTEWMLRGTLFFYVALGLAAFIGAPYFGRRAIREWRRKRRAAWPGRLFLLCLSCLLSFVTLEVGAATVHAWTHRFPALPTTFPEEPEGEYRILVLGESSALGEPYRPWVSVGQIVAWKLGDDGLPIRCPGPFREAFSKVAARRPGCVLIDGRLEVAAASPTGLLDDHVIEDAHHPNLKGYVAIASAILRELAPREVFGPASAAIRPPGLADCVSHFGMNSTRLAVACDRTSVHYARVSGYRYDPGERLAKSRKFAEAARRLRAGASIDEVGLPAFDPKETRQGASPT
jgi:hypothetical protein